MGYSSKINAGLGLWKDWTILCQVRNVPWGGWLLEHACVGCPTHKHPSWLRCCFLWGKHLLGGCPFRTPRVTVVQGSWADLVAVVLLFLACLASPIILNLVPYCVGLKKCSTLYKILSGWWGGAEWWGRYKPALVSFWPARRAPSWVRSSPRSRSNTVSWTYTNGTDKSHTPKDLGVSCTTSQIKKAGADPAAGPWSSFPCASFAVFGACPFGTCGDPAAFQGWAADWWDRMADTPQQFVQMVVMSNGNVWFWFIKNVPKQIKGQLSVLFVARLEHCLLRKAEKALGYHAKQGRRDDWS